MTRRPYLLLALIALGAVAAYFTGCVKMMRLDSVLQHRMALRDVVGLHPLLSGAIFVGAFALAVVLSLPVGTVLTLLGGFLFGPLLGTLLAVAAGSVGALGVFAVAKSSLGATLRARAGPLYRKAEANMQANAFGYLLFLRLVPVFPFVLVNVLPALFNVSTRVYLLTTVLGILPGAYVFAELGGELGRITSLSELVSPQTLLAFTGLGVLALLPSLIRQARAGLFPSR